MRGRCAFAHSVTHPQPTMSKSMSRHEHTGLRIGALILAAGEGARMGRMPKCLIRVEGRTLLRRLRDAMAAMGVARMVAVTGYHAEPIEAELAGMPSTPLLQVVRNPSPEAGQQSSVRTGLQALGAEFDLIVVALADQPGVGSEELSEPISAFRHRPAGTSVVMPMVDGQRGNPVVFSGALIAGLMTGGLTGGLRAYIDAHPEVVHRFVTGNPNFTLDLDTREDVEQLSRSRGLQIQWPATAFGAPG